MTLSVLGRCARTDEMGVAVCSSSMAVAARCAHARGGVGVVATQNVTDPRLGPALLDSMAAGASASDAIAQITAGRPGVEHRQVVALGVRGDGAAFTGDRGMPVAGSRVAVDVVTAGNLLRGAHVLDAIVASFSASPDDDLATRLVAALAAGVEAGGEHDPVRAAGVLVVGEQRWPTTDLRVDWTGGDPVDELAALVRRWQPQAAAFLQRALDPDTAPGF